jgi:hypothetical protein
MWRAVLLTAVACAALLALLSALQWVPLDATVTPAPDSRALLVGKEPFALQRYAHGARLVAKGSTHLHILVVPVCSAVLYLEPRVENRAVLKDVPKALEIAYGRHVPAAAFRESTRVLIERNGLMSPRVARRVSEFNALYRAVQPGDRYLLEYHPRRGVVYLRLNGHVLGHVPSQLGARDAEFAAALFSVWFGRKAFHTVFRADLLRPLAPPVEAFADRRRAAARGHAGQAEPEVSGGAAAAVAASSTPLRCACLLMIRCGCVRDGASRVRRSR